MKIIDVSALVLSYPLEKKVETSFGKMDSRTSVLVRVDTDQGITGIGESWTNFPHWAPEERRITIEKGIKPLLVGENPLEVTRLWHKMYGSLIRSGAGLQYGSPGPLMQSISGVDIALWDILGKHLNAPVFKLLGGPVNQRIPAYASGLGPRGFEGYVEAALEAGYESFKLKVGFGKQLDLQNLKTIRSLIGDDRPLMIDANQAWRDAFEALDHLEAYGEFRPAFIEEPVPAGQLADLKRIRESRLLPVAGGENVYGRQEFREVLTAGCLDIVQPDITKTGGLSEARTVCQMAQAWGIPYAPHMFGTAVGLAASLHLLASTPCGLYMEVDANPNPLRTDLLTESFFRWERGVFVIHEEKPGLGIELDPAVLKAYN